MTRKLGWLVLVVVFALPAVSSEQGKISGSVKDSTGVPQMGAMVELYGPYAAPRKFFTDARGRYSILGLAAGVYQIKVSAPSFLPSLRENIHVRTGLTLLVNVTLNTLFEAIQLVPARRQTVEDDENWKWTLRSMSSRPVLRVVDDTPLVVVSSSEDNSDTSLKARVAFIAGVDSDGLGSTAGMTTAVDFEKSLFGNGNLVLGGDFAHNREGVMPGAVMRAEYSHRMANGSEPKLTFMVRRMSTSQLSSHSAALQALALTLSNNFSVANVFDLNFGTELQSVQFGENATSVNPFGSVVWHLSPNTFVEYGYTTIEPNMRSVKGFDSAPADLSESGPRVSIVNWQPVVEHSRHQELSISRRIGRNKAQFAVYSDHLKDPALAGTGDVDMESGAYMPDFTSGTFSYGARDLSARGMRLVYERELTKDLSATFDYAYGDVLEAPFGVSIDNIKDVITSHRHHAVGYKMSGTTHWCKGRWIASYRWTNGTPLTPVDLFNSGPGQSDPYLSFFLKQPIPGTGFVPGHIEALIDVRNLMAQGYVPVVGQDGHTVYLVQSARAVRGGVAFTF